MLSIIAAVALKLVAPSEQPKCGDDQGVDRFSMEAQRFMLKRYGLQPIESATKDQVRRIFFVDGNGHDTIALEFIRAAEKSPVVKVYFPSENGEADIAPLETALSVGQWDDIINLSRDFDRDFVQDSAPKVESGLVVVCVHSWVYWVSANDPGEPTKSKVQDSCSRPPMQSFVWLAAKMAVASFPHCDLLDRTLSRNDAALLRSCSFLSGDRLAAAEVFNRAGGFRSIDRPGGLDDLGHYALALDFQGVKTSGNEAKVFWASRINNSGSPNFYYRSIHGLSAKVVIVDGELIRETGRNSNVYERAGVSMRWEADGGRFELKSLTVGPYHPRAIPSE